jgi:pimeloyl-ACP methyl ester carboxylesterase
MGVRVHYTSRRASLRIATALLVGTTLAAGGALGAPTLAVPSSPTDSAATAGAGNGFEKLELIPCHIEGVSEEVRCGTYKVYENRLTHTGRRLPLKVILIPALHPHAERGPVFEVVGGPGETATDLPSYLLARGDRNEDIVLVDERGTGVGHRLDCPPPGSDDNVQGYLKAPFDPAPARACRDELEKKFDLRQYSTANYIEDLDEVRAALGYEKVNLEAGSFGTFASLLYMRSHAEHVRSAYLTSLVTLSNRVPLDHARSAQEALDSLFADCRHDAACHAAYPHVADDFAALIKELEAGPVRTWVHHPVTGARTEVELSEPTFADAVRITMYSGERAHELPFLIEQAKAGNFNPFAEAAMHATRGIYTRVRLGLNYSVTCSETVSRIRPEEVEPATRGSYFGTWRVRSQMALCRVWPRTELPPGFFEPFRLDVPALLVSGDNDPATRPAGGEEVKSFMPNAVHVVVRGGGHTPEDECTRALRAQLFATGKAQGIDLSCIAQSKPPPFKLPGAVSGVARTIATRTR